MQLPVVQCGAEIVSASIPHRLSVYRDDPVGQTTGSDAMICQRCVKVFLLGKIVLGMSFL